MKDDFKRNISKFVGVGGVRCYCCNDFFGKGRKKLHKFARGSLKIDNRKIIKEGIEEYEESIYS